MIAIIGAVALSVGIEIISPIRCGLPFGEWIREISFSQSEGFEVQYSGLDKAAGEKEYGMAWKQK